MAEPKTKTNKKYRLLQARRIENKEVVLYGDVVPLAHLSQKDIDFLTRKQVYKEVT